MDHQQNPQKPKRFLIIALLCSAALNVFAIGAFSSAWYFSDQHHAPPHRGDFHAQSKNRLIEKLPGRADIIESAYANHGDELRAKLRSLRDARRSAHKTLMQTDFDVAQAQQAFADLRRAESALAESAQTILIEISAQLTPEERALMRRQRPKRTPPPDRPER